MISLVYLTVRVPSALADELMLAGYRVFEALAISEASYLCKQEQIDLVVIGPGIQSAGLTAIQRSHITVLLKPEATAKDLIWELSHLFSNKSRSLQ